VAPSVKDDVDGNKIPRRLEGMCDDSLRSRLGPRSGRDICLFLIVPDQIVVVMGGGKISFTLTDELHMVRQA
jgi:hypothetical protein